MLRHLLYSLLHHRQSLVSLSDLQEMRTGYHLTQSSASHPNYRKSEVCRTSLIVQSQLLRNPIFSSRDIGIVWIFLSPMRSNLRINDFVYTIILLKDVSGSIVIVFIASIV